MPTEKRTESLHLFLSIHFFHWGEGKYVVRGKIYGYFHDYPRNHKSYPKYLENMALHEEL